MKINIEPEDFQKITKITKIIVLITLIFLIVITIIYFVLKTINNKKYTEYLLNNNFKNTENNIYTLTTEEKNSNISYIYTKKNNILSKSITTTINGIDEQIELNIKNPKEITIDYFYTGIDNDGINHENIQSATYNRKNNKFKCSIQSTINSKQQCKKIKKETITFNKYIKDIEKNGDIKLSLIR